MQVLCTITLTYYRNRCNHENKKSKNLTKILNDLPNIWPAKYKIKPNPNEIIQEIL